MIEQLKEALRVFLFGFGGVFAGLILLMWVIQITTVMLRLLTPKKK